MPRRWFVLVAIGLVTGSCAPTTFELARVQRSDVRVLPGKGGYLNPLTGVVSYTPQAWQQRPALSIKIGNTAPERPQAGIDKADLVYEEIVEGGATRLIAVFLTNSPDRIGPVRSARFVDPVILRPIGGLIGYSGGVSGVVDAVHASPLKDVGAFAQSAAYLRDSARNAPYNLYTSASTLWKGQQGSPPKPLFDWLSSADDKRGGGTSGVSASFAFSNDFQIGYTYDTSAGEYRRTMNGNTHQIEAPGGGAQLAFANVLIEKVGVSAGSYTDRAGNRTQDSDVLGSGQAILLRGGRAFHGTWSRASVDQATKFTDVSGQLRLAPGSTIVELVPNGQTVSVA